jgi:putative transcriptional regulator
MSKKYRSDAFAAIHETMESLHEIGAVDKQTMREFDEACLTSVHVLSPEEISLGSAAPQCGAPGDFAFQH